MTAIHANVLRAATIPKSAVPEGSPCWTLVEPALAAQGQCPPHDVKKLDNHPVARLKRLTSEPTSFDHADELVAENGALVHGVCPGGCEGLSADGAESDFDQRFA